MILNDAPYSQGALDVDGHAAVSSRAVETQEDECTSAINFLQTRVRTHSFEVNVSVEFPQLPLPISWFHVPRAGASFFFNLASLLGVCKATLNFNQTYLPSYVSVVNQCPGLFIRVQPNIPAENLRSRKFGYLSEHISVHASLQAGAHLMGMFRQPESRLLSDWQFSSAGFYGKWRVSDMNLEEFAIRGQGCTMRMLLDDDHEYHCIDGPPQFEPETKMPAAIEVLHKFSFVGLTEEWELSMCLFNVMFGTPCRAEQFWDYSVHATNTSAKESLPRGFLDLYDGPVLEVAHQIFNKSLVRYGVSYETCNACFQQVGMRSSSAIAAEQYLDSLLGGPQHMK